MTAAMRVRRVVAQYGLVIAVGLVVLSLVSFSAVWTAAQPTTETRETPPKYSESVSTETHTSALVTGNTSLYERGERLWDMPVYLFGASPNLTVWMNTSIGATRPTRVTHRITARYRATKEGTTFWESERELVEVTRTVEDGSLSTDYTFDLRTVTNATRRQRAEIGSAGTFHTTIRQNVTYEVLEEPTYGGNFVTDAAPVISGNSYWLDGTLSGSRTHSEAGEPETVTIYPSTTAYLPFALFGVLALALAALTVVYGRRIDVESIDTELYRSRYEEWISEGEFPTNTEKKYIRINSLEDLVDIAIDSNKRVIFDGDYDAFAVIDGDLVYYFSTERLDDWLDV